MIQGVTANLKGGAPGGVGKEILRSVGRGLFELNRKAEKVIQERVSQLRTMDVMSATLGRAGEVERFYVSYETDLQRFLERNPSAIENGLELVEREVDVEAGGRIDLLCKDTENTLVVVELKVGTADDRTLGQLQRYIGWVTRKKATPGQRVRGIIVAETFDESLRYSTLGTTTKTLRYRIDVSCQEAWSADK